MKKILFRFFMICLIVTIGLAFVISFLDKEISSKENYAYMDTITKGKFISLDKFLKNYPVSEWNDVLKKIKPKEASAIYVVPVNSLSLSKRQLEKLLNNEIVTIFDKSNTFYPAIIYKLTSDRQYVYQEFLNFSLMQRAQRYFGWPPYLIAKELGKIPAKQWPDYIQTLSAQYGFDIKIMNIEDTRLNENEKNQLLSKAWVVSFPENSDQIIKHIYVPVNKERVLRFGPMHYVTVGVYGKYVVFTAALIAIEFIVFILALLYFRTLDKLKILASDFSKGNFDSNISVGSSSSLYPLFENLKSMGYKIEKLITSHKELTHAVSHELRTPLSRMRFSLELLRQECNKDEMNKHLNSIDENIHELDELIEEMLSYAKLDRHFPHLEFQCLDMRDILLEAIEKFEKSFDRKKIITHVNINMPVMVSVNRRYMDRCLQNLLQNAGKHARSLIDVSFIQCGNNLFEISIEDDGSGVLEEDRERIFEPFFQKQNNSSGFGLGLAIVKKIVDIHGWQIQVTNSKLGGAKFSLLFFN